MSLLLYLTGTSLSIIAGGATVSGVVLRHGISCLCPLQQLLSLYERTKVLLEVEEEASETRD